MIYVPSHLRKLKLLDDFCRLIEEYDRLGYREEPKTSFDNYYASLSLDPVKKFLKFCILENDDEAIINYVSNLFYSVKGTVKVLDFMEKYLHLGIQNLEYNTRVISFTIPVVTLRGISENEFYKSLLDFLGALLYFQEARITITLINLYISNSLNNYTAGGVITYRENNPIIFEEL